MFARVVYFKFLEILCTGSAKEENILLAESKGRDKGLYSILSIKLQLKIKL